MADHLRLDHLRVVLAIVVVCGLVTACSPVGREERGVGYVTILETGHLEVYVGCPSDDPEFTVEEDDEQVALSVAYTETDDACARSASPLLARPLGDRTIHDRITGELAIVEDHRCWPHRQGARRDGVASAPAPPPPPRPDPPPETTALPSTTLRLPVTTTTVGPPSQPTTTRGLPPLSTSRSVAGCAWTSGCSGASTSASPADRSTSWCSVGATPSSS